MDKRLSSDSPTEIVSENKTSDARADGLVQLVQSWMDEGDTDEQRETLEYLIHALDEDRLSNRTLFPKELHRRFEAPTTRVYRSLSLLLSRLFAVPSTVVKCYRPPGRNSTERYNWIACNLSAMVEEAIAIRNQYQTRR